MPELNALMQEIDGLKDRPGRGLQLHFNGVQSGLVQDSLLKVANHMIGAGTKALSVEKVVLLALKHTAASIPEDGFQGSPEAVEALQEQIEKALKELKPQELRPTSIKAASERGKGPGRKPGPKKS